MMAKVSVKGSDQTPLYQFLTDKTLNPTTGGEIKWNFTKFIFDRDGNASLRDLNQKSLPIHSQVTCGDRERLSVNSVVHTAAERDNHHLISIFLSQSVRSLSAHHLAHVVRDFASRGS